MKIKDMNNEIKILSLIVFNINVRVENKNENKSKKKNITGDIEKLFKLTFLSGFMKIIKNIITIKDTALDKMNGKKFLRPSI